MSDSFSQKLTVLGIKSRTRPARSISSLEDRSWYICTDAQDCLPFQHRCPEWEISAGWDRPAQLQPRSFLRFSPSPTDSTRKSMNRCFLIVQDENLIGVVIRIMDPDPYQGTPNILITKIELYFGQFWCKRRTKIRNAFTSPMGCRARYENVLPELRKENNNISEQSYGSGLMDPELCQLQPNVMNKLNFFQKVSINCPKCVLKIWHLWHRRQR